MPLDATPATRLDAPPHDSADTLATSRMPCRSIRWACIYTHPQAERWANTNLQRSGFTTYLPLYVTRVRDNAIRSLWHTVERPLFARYLFIRFNHTATSWSPIRATPGVVDLVRSGTDPAYASDAAISTLQALDHVRRTLTPPEPLWRPGAACKLAHGPFQGWDAVVTAVHHDRALVALLMLGHLREVQVSLDCLAARD